MRSKFTLLVLLFCISFSLHALDLKPIPEGQAIVLEGNQGKIACDQIVKSMADLLTKMDDHEASLLTFLEQVSRGLLSWHKQVEKFENTPEIIPIGSFSVLQDAATKTDTITGVAYDNKEYIVGQMARILAAARTCSITAPTLVPARK